MPAARKDRKSGHDGLFNPATVILLCATGLAVLGIIILFSATAAGRADPYFFVRRQAIWMGLALIAGLLASRLDLENLRRYTWVLAGVTLAGLVAVLHPALGIEVNGSRRWLEFGAMRVQVSEFAKLGLVFSLAHYFGANQKLIPTFFRGFVVPGAWIGVFAGLIILEPDFGTAFLCGVIGLGIMFLAGVRLVYLTPAVALGVGAFALAVVHSPVRLARITAFLDVHGNRSDGAYQLWQAMLAFGAGGVEGVGLGNGRQQMAFLPEAHTDFIFAIVGEELGLPFSLAVVILFGVIFAAGLMHLRRAPNLFQFLLVAGCLLLVSLQALINLGVVTGCLPTKGMSLPFISYGGSNLVLMAVIVGLIFNTRRTWRRPGLMQGKRAMREVVA